MPRDLYVQYGCGLSVGEGWLNYDSSPTLLLQRMPVIGLVTSKVTGVVNFPPEVRYGDICEGPLSEAGSAAGVYASHVLEHLSLDDCRRALCNTLAMLRPGGTFRLVVPDLEVRAKRYLELRASEFVYANAHFLDSAHLGIRKRPKGFTARLRSTFGNSHHLWMWDEASMSRALSDAGFCDIRRCEFNDSPDPMFLRVEERGRFHDQNLDYLELAIECRRPA